MSRVGKKPIDIPKGNTVSLKDGDLTVKGPKGEISRKFNPEIEIVVSEEEISLNPKKSDVFTNSLWGTYASHIKNMVEGVNKGFEKKLIIEGVGFKAEVKEKELVMNLGFSHPVTVPIPEGITATSEKGNISISGVDKELVGQFTAKIRSFKKPEPYKGKGIRYEGEIIRRKQGKKSV